MASQQTVVIESYLRHNWPCRFDFLRIGEFCNGSRSFCFSDAFCDLQQIESQTLPGVPLAINIRTLFGRGFEILEAQKSEKSIKMSQKETRAMESLNDFMFKISTHEKCLLNALEKIKTESSKETVLRMALAEHLFSPLASGYSYIIDARVQEKGANKICKCGCNSPVKFDATGMGHCKVWHGYADIIIKDENPVEIVRVVLNPTELDAGGDSGPSTAKKPKTEDDESVGMSSNSEVRLKRKGDWDQTVAQTIVFALAQRQLMSCCRTFVPNILICQKQFYIIMYDPENDILIWSGGFNLWRNVYPRNLNKIAIITLWMVIHYKLFCTGGGILQNVDKVKAGFLDHIRGEQKKYYKELAIGVSNFDTEEIDFLAQGHTMTDMFMDIEEEL